MEKEKIPISKCIKITYVSYTFKKEADFIRDWFNDYSKTMYLYNNNINKFIKPLNNLCLDNKGSISLWNPTKNISIKRKTIKKIHDNDFEEGRIMKLIEINGINIENLDLYNIIHLYKNTSENNCTVIIQQNFKFDPSLYNEILYNNRIYIEKMNKYLSSLKSNLFLIESIMIMRPYAQIYKILMDLNVMNKEKYKINSIFLNDGIIIEKEKNENIVIKYNLIKLSNISTYIEVKKIIRKKDMNYEEQKEEIKFNKLFLKKFRNIMESLVLEDI